MAKKTEPTADQASLFPPPGKPKVAKEPMLFVVKATSRSSRCRGPNCKKVIYWHYGEKTGRTTIVDCAPAYPANAKKHGEVHPMAAKCFPPVHPMAPGEHFGVGMDGQGIDHHLTCHDVDMFGGRKTTRRNQPDEPTGGESDA